MLLLWAFCCGSLAREAREPSAPGQRWVSNGRVACVKALCRGRVAGVLRSVKAEVKASMYRHASKRSSRVCHLRRESAAAGRERHSSTSTHPSPARHNSRRAVRHHTRTSHIRLAALADSVAAHASTQLLCSRRFAATRIAIAHRCSRTRGPPHASKSHREDGARRRTYTTSGARRSKVRGSLHKSALADARRLAAARGGRVPRGRREERLLELRGGDWGWLW